MIELQKVPLGTALALRRTEGALPPIALPHRPRDIRRDMASANIKAATGNAHAHAPRAAPLNEGR